MEKKMREEESAKEEKAERGYRSNVRLNSKAYGILSS
jgi:hypothetical protein